MKGFQCLCFLFYKEQPNREKSASLIKDFVTGMKLYVKVRVCGERVDFTLQFIHVLDYPELERTLRRSAYIIRLPPEVGVVQKK